MALRALEAELAVEQRLVSSLEAALAVCVSHEPDGRLQGRAAVAGGGREAGGGGTPAVQARGEARRVDQVKQLDATIQMLVGRLQRACEQPERTQQQLAALIKDKRALQHRIAALEKREQETQAACERQRRLGDKATNSVLRLRTENNRLKSEIDKLTQRLAEADGALEKMRARADKLEVELAERTGQLREKARELERWREQEKEQAQARERERSVERRRERDREKERERELASDSVKVKLEELELLKKALIALPAGVPGGGQAAAAAAAASGDAAAASRRGDSVACGLSAGKVRFSDQEEGAAGVAKVGAEQGGSASAAMVPQIAPTSPAPGDREVLQQLYRQLESNQRNIADFLRASVGGEAGGHGAGAWLHARGGAGPGADEEEESSGVVVALAVPGGVEALGGIEGLQEGTRTALATALGLGVEALHVQAMLSSPPLPAGGQEEGQRVLLCVLLAGHGAPSLSAGGGGSGAGESRGVTWMSEAIQQQLQARVGPFCGEGHSWNVLSVALLPHIAHFTGGPTQGGHGSGFASGEGGEVSDGGQQRIDVAERAGAGVDGMETEEGEVTRELRAQLLQVSEELRAVRDELRQARAREEKAAAEADALVIAAATAREGGAARQQQLEHEQEETETIVKNLTIAVGEVQRVSEHLAEEGAAMQARVGRMQGALLEQEAASAECSRLRALLEEKTRQLEAAKDELDDARARASSLMDAATDLTAAQESLQAEREARAAAEGEARESACAAEQARAEVAAAEEGLKAGEVSREALAEAADALRGKLEDAERCRLDESEKHERQLAERRQEWEEAAAEAQRAREMEWERERGVERGLLQEELRRRKEEIAVVREAAEVMESSLVRMEQEILEEVKRLEGEVESVAGAKAGVEEELRKALGELVLVREKGEVGLKEAEATRMQEIEELKGQREQLQASLAAATRQGAAQQEAAGRAEAEMLGQIGALEAQGVEALAHIWQCEHQIEELEAQLAQVEAPLAAADAAAGVGVAATVAAAAAAEDKADLAARLEAVSHCVG